MFVRSAVSYHFQVQPPLSNESINPVEMDEALGLDDHLSVIQEWTDDLEAGDLSKIKDEKIFPSLKKALSHFEQIVLERENTSLEELQASWLDLLAIEEALHSFLDVAKEVIEAYRGKTLAKQIKAVLKDVKIAVPSSISSSYSAGYLASRLLFPPLLIVDSLRYLQSAISIEGQTEELRGKFLAKASDLCSLLDSFNPTPAYDLSKQRKLEKAAKQIKEEEKREGMSESQKRFIYRLFAFLQLSSQLIENSKRESVPSLIGKEIARHTLPLTKAQEKEVAFVGLALGEKRRALQKMNDGTFERFTRRFPHTRSFLDPYRRGKPVEPEKLSEIMDLFRKTLQPTPPWIDFRGAFGPCRKPPPERKACRNPVTETALEKWLQSPDLDANPRLFAHFLGETFGKNSGLEGYSFNGMLTFMRDALKQMQSVDENPGVYAKMISQFEKAEKINQALEKGPEEASEMLQKELVQLKERESLFFLTPWVSKDLSHMIILRFHKQEDGKITLRIFNNGSGLNYHRLAIIDSQLFHGRFTELSGISLEKITELPFCKTLFRMRTPPPFGKWEGVEVYEGWVSILAPSKISRGKGLQGLSKTLEVRFCTFFSIAHWWQDEDPELFASALIQIETKLYASFLKQGDFQSERDRILLEKGGEQLLRNAKTAFGKGVLTEKAWEAIQEQVVTPSNQIAASPLTLESAPFRAKALLPDLLSGKKNGELRGKSFDLLIQEKRILDPKTCLEEATRLHTKFSDEIGKGNFNMIFLAILEWIESIPFFKKEEWRSALNPEETLSLLDQLSEIGLDYIFSNLRVAPSSASPRHSLAMIKLLTLGHAVSAAFDGNGGLVLPHLYQKNMDLLLEGTSGSGHLFDPKLEDDLRYLRNYWRRAEPLENRKKLSFFGFEFIPGSNSYSVGVQRWIFETKKGRQCSEFSLSKVEWVDLEWIGEYIQRPEIAHKIDADPDLTEKIPAAQALILFQRQSPLLPPPLFSLYKLSFLVDFTMRGNRPANEIRLDSDSRKRGIQVDLQMGNFVFQGGRYRGWAPTTKVFGHITKPSYNYCPGLDHIPLPDANFPLMLSQDSLPPEREAVYHGKKWIEECKENGWSQSNFRRRVPPRSRLIEFPAKPTLPWENSIDMPLQPMREKLALSGVPQLQIRETLAYYREKTRLLENREDRFLFKRLFFDPLLLGDFFLSYPDERGKLISHFEDFWQRGARTYTDLGRPLVAAFYLEMGNLFDRFLSHFSDRHPKRPVRSIEPVAELRSLMARKLYSPEEATVLYLDLILMQNPDSLDKEGAVDLVEASIQLQSSTWPKKFDGENLNPAYPNEKEIRAREHLLGLRSPLQRLLNGSDRDEILNSAVQRLIPSFQPAQWKEHPQFPSFTTLDQTLYLDIFTGQFIRSGGSRKPLPIAVRQNPQIASLLHPNEETLSFEGGVFEYQVSSGKVKLHTYEFLSKKGEWIRLFYHPAHGLFAIQKKIEDRWVQNIHSSSLQIPAALRKKEEYWISIDPPDRVWIGENYTINLEIEKLFRIDTGWQLGNIPPSSPFLSIENSDYILPWLDPMTGKLKQIELPRLSLVFDVDDEGQAFSRQFEGYRIASDQAVPALGDLKNYLVLEKGGEKIVLIPSYPRVVQKGGLETTAPFNRGKEEPLLPYGLDSRGNLIPKTPAARLYLAYFFLTEQRYDDALDRLVGTGSELRPFQALEWEILHWISSEDEIVQDPDPRAASLRLKAQLLLMREKEGFFISDKREFNEFHFFVRNKEEMTESHYERVLQQRDQIPPRFLPTAKEQACLARHFKGVKKPRVYSKIHPEEDSLPNVRSRESLEDDREALDFLSNPGKSFDWLSGFPKTPREDAYFLRTKEWDQDFILKAYLCMQEPTEERLRALYGDFFPKLRQPLSEKQLQEETRDSLLLIATGESAPSERALSALLLAVQDKPALFPSHSNLVEALQKDREFEVWAKGRLIPPLQTHGSDYLIRPDYSPIDIVRSPPETPPSPQNGESTRLRTALIQPDVHFQPLFVSQVLSPYDEAHRELLEVFSSDKEMREVLEDFFLSPKAKPKEFHLREVDGLEKLEKSVRTSLLAARELEERREIELLKEVNGLDVEPTEKLYQTGAYLSSWERPIALPELLKLFLTLDVEALQVRNPALSIADCHAIFQKTQEFLVAATQRQHLERVLKKCSDAQKVGGAEREGLIQELAVEGGQRRGYLAAKHPEYLLLEYASGIRLREEQVKTLEGFVPGTAQEAIMGFGKTKVLLPLLTVFLSSKEGKRFPMIVMPKDLVPSMSEELEKTLATLGFSIDVFHFDRETYLHEEELERVYERMERTIQEKRVVLMSEADLESFFLMGIEAFYGERLEASQFRKIFALMKRSGHLVLDEMHLLLDLFRAYHFSDGEKDPLCTVEMDSAARLFPLLFSLGWNGASIDKEEYEAHWKERIIDRALEAEEFALYSKKDLKDYLLEKPEGERYVDRIAPRPIQSLLATYKEQINELFPLVLTNQIDEHFGKVPPDKVKSEEERWMAIPYHGSQNPVIGSQFGSDLEVIDYTIRLHLAKGIDLEIFERECDFIRSQISQEMDDLGIRDHRETAAYKRFVQLTGTDRYPLYKLQDKERQAILENINRNPLLKIELIRSWILPALSTYPRQLFTNGHIFSQLAATIRGFSGTNWNSKTFPRDFQNQISSDTVGVTLHLLQSKKEAVLISPTVNGLIDPAIDPARGRSLADRGAAFREVKSNRETARKLLDRSSAKGVVYYEGDDLKVLLRDQKDPIPYASCLLAKEELIAFWDQKHTTGADIALGAEAEAIVTVGRHTHFFELLQAAWRMRGLGRRQKIQFALLEEEAIFIRNALGARADLQLADLFKYTWMKQQEKGKEHSIRALKFKMANAWIAPIWEQICDEEQPLPHPKILDRLFYLEKRKDPWERYGKISRPTPKEEYVRDLAEAFLSDPLMEKLPPSVQERIGREIRAVAQEELPHLPDSISSTTLYGTEMSRQVKTNTQTEQQKKQETERQTEVAAVKDLYARNRDYSPRGVVSWSGPLSPADFIPSLPSALASQVFIRPKDGIYSLNHFRGKGLRPVVTVNGALQEAGLAAPFDEELMASATFLPLQQEKAMSGERESYPFVLFGKHQDIVQEILLIQTEQIGMMLISQDEALQFRQGAFSENLALYLLGYGLFGQKPSFPSEEQLHANPKFMRLKVQAKFFNGEVFYSKEELPALESWLSDLDRQGRLDSAKLFFEIKILEWKETSKREYPNSPLFRCFNRIIG